MDKQDFLLYLLTKGLRKPTAEAYLRFLSAIDFPITKDSVTACILDSLNRGVKNSSINMMVRAVRRYCEFKELAWGKEVSYLKEQVTERSTLSDQEIEDLIALEKPPRYQQGVWDRWTLFLKVMAYTGMRPGEVATLEKENIDFGTNNFLLPITKTVPRRVPIPLLLIEDLKKAISNTNKYLFPSTGEKPHIWRNGWIKHFRVRANLLGLRKATTIYSLRHSFITSLIEEDVALPKIMKVVGHRNIETTFRYTHLTNKDAQEAVRRLPLNKKNTSSEEALNQVLEDLKKTGIFEREDITYQISKNKIVIEISGKKVDSEVDERLVSKVRPAFG